VVCCWLHLSRIAVVYFSQHSPVLQAFAKAKILKSHLYGDFI
jgi:hypothetical protein